MAIRHPDGNWAFRYRCALEKLNKLSDKEKEKQMARLEAELNEQLAGSSSSSSVVDAGAVEDPLQRSARFALGKLSLKTCEVIVYSF